MARTRTAVPDTYETLHAGFRWQVPARFNIARACCTRWAADRERVAVILDREGAAPETWTFARLHDMATRLMGVLAAAGVKPGDRVALLLPQRPETAAAHVAIHRLGAVSMPLSLLFGPDAIGYRLADSGAVAAIVEGAVLPALREARTQGPGEDGLRQVLVMDDAGCTLRAADGETDFATALAAAPAAPADADTAAEDPAVLIYTSGTTGAPKGALIPHRALLGNLTGFDASQDGFGRPSDVFWSPADWAWTGGLMDALLPSMHAGMPIVATPGRFSAQRALEVMARHRVTNSFLFPTALKAIMKAEPEPRGRHDLTLRALMSAGESLGETVFDWCAEELGFEPNEMFGQTEINYVVGNSSRRWPAPPGSIGRAYPGHRVAVIDEDGRVLPAGQLGEVAVHRLDRHGHPDPVFFLGYWKREQATRDKYTGDWCRTGDLATRDEAGNLWYGGRADDMFKAAGYRIGPGEIENCLVQHPRVANAAVVPKPDAERGNVVKAYVVPVAGTVADEALVAELQAHVRARLAPYEYPKEIEFIEALPMTVTGKVQRRVLRIREEERARPPAAPASP